MQALIAWGSGGIDGLGLGNGRQKMSYLPYAHTDFIFPIVGEELGLRFSLLVVFLFVLIIVCGMTIALHARDRFGMLLASGIVSLIGFQAAINIGVVTSLLPNKGLPLPFVSYGGSNLVVALFASWASLKHLPTGRARARTEKGNGDAGPGHAEDLKWNRHHAEHEAHEEERRFSSRNPAFLRVLRGGTSVEQLMNTVIACGGTGGHLFPGLAVAEVLRARGHEVLLFISEKEIDTLAVEGRKEFRFEKLPTVALPSPFSPAILAFVRRFNESLSLCRAIFRKFNPHVVLGMGGFTSTAPVLAGRMRGIPTFIHESNAFPGKANRHTARFVRAVLLGFKECAAFFPKAQTEFTGTPIRSSLQRIDRAEALEKLGLRPEIPTLLVMGGSQGASGINQALIKALPALQASRSR